MSARKTISLGLLALGGVASIGMPQGVFAAPARLSPAAGVCRTVVGLEAGDAQFNACITSLDSSLGSLGATHALADARAACIDRGLQLGTTALALCTLEGEDSASPRSTLPVKAPATAAPGKSWFYASSAERRRREQLACASVGLDPTSPVFDSCVAGLAVSLLEADHPEP